MMISSVQSSFNYSASSVKFGSSTTNGDWIVAYWTTTPLYTTADGEFQRLRGIFKKKNGLQHDHQVRVEYRQGYETPTFNRVTGRYEMVFKFTKNA